MTTKTRPAQKLKALFGLPASKPAPPPAVIDDNPAVSPKQAAELRKQATEQMRQQLRIGHNLHGMNLTTEQERKNAKALGGKVHGYRLLVRLEPVDDTSPEFAQKMMTKKDLDRHIKHASKQLVAEQTAQTIARIIAIGPSAFTNAASCPEGRDTAHIGDWVLIPKYVDDGGRMWKHLEGVPCPEGCPEHDEHGLPYHYCLVNDDAIGMSFKKKPKVVRAFNRYAIDALWQKQQDDEKARLESAKQKQLKQEAKS